MQECYKNAGEKLRINFGLTSILIYYGYFNIQIQMLINGLVSLRIKLLFDKKISLFFMILTIIVYCESEIYDKYAINLHLSHRPPS